MRKTREPDIRANDITVKSNLNINDAATIYMNGPASTKFEFAPAANTVDSYRYGMKLDSDVFFNGGAAKKHYMVQIGGDVETASTGDSNGAYLKLAGSNYAASDANYILRGLNIGITNRSGGTMGRLENSLGVQNKSGGTTPVLIGATIIAENYGTNATECFAIDAIVRDEAGAGTTRAGIRIRNDDRSGVAAMDAMLLMDSHASSGGADTLINAQAVELTEYDSGTQVVLMTFQGANATTYYLVHDTDAATVLSVATSVS